MSEARAEVATGPADTAWLSWLRVVAICAVVTIHTTGSNAAQPGARETLRGQLALVLDNGSKFAVPVFVMVSGAMLLDPSRFRGPRAFLRRRAGRLVPAIVFWHLWYLALRVFVKGDDLGGREILARVLNGNLYTALYFFWIILGLSLVAPLLVPYVRDNGRRGALVAGLVATSMSVLTVATMRVRATGVVFAETAFTWWVPYVGLFLLGYALRDVRLRGARLWLGALGVVALALLNAWQWRNPSAPGWLEDLSPVGYYSATGVLLAILVYLVTAGLVSPAGPLRVATGPRAARLGRTLGDATLGVFALHLTVLYAARRAGIGGERWASPTTHDLAIRLLVVLVVTWAIVLVLRRVPYLRALL